MISVFGLDIGGIGHISPLPEVVGAMNEALGRKVLGYGFIKNAYVSSVGDGITVVIVHSNNRDDELVHRLAWGVFCVGIEITKLKRGHAVGQDLSGGEFSRNMRDVGAQVLEMETNGNGNLLVATDKTHIDALNAVALAYIDPRINPGLAVSPQMDRGYILTLIDTHHQGAGNRIVEMMSWEFVPLYVLLFMQRGRFALRKIRSVATGEVGAMISVSKLIEGHDDPMGIFSTQGGWPIAGDILRSLAGAMVSGASRGLRKQRLCLVPDNTGTVLENPICSAILFGAEVWHQDCCTRETELLFSAADLGQVFLSPEEAENSTKHWLDQLDSRFEVVA